MTPELKDHQVQPPCSLGYELHDGIWYRADTLAPETSQELIPTDWPLNFHAAFVQGCIQAHEVETLGSYAMGWEL